MFSKVPQTLGNTSGGSGGLFAEVIQDVRSRAGKATTSRLSPGRGLRQLDHRELPVTSLITRSTKRSDAGLALQDSRNPFPISRELRPGTRNSRSSATR